VPWNYFSNALTDSTGSLVRSSNMLSKVYFPRLVLPIAAVLSKMFDFGINLVLLFVLMLLFQMLPTAQIVFLPLLILIMFLSATGLGMWLTALAVQYRDVNYGVGFGTRLLLYTVPVIYPLSLIPDHFRLIYGLNPMVGVIEGFRSALLNTNPMPWDLIILGGVVSVALFLSGALYFQRAERIFADVA
jgi:lipopolysaccharide transport system permease protein